MHIMELAASKQQIKLSFPHKHQQLGVTARELPERVKADWLLKMRLINERCILVMKYFYHI